MLHPSTVQPGTLELLKHLLQLPELSAFALAGGTSLAMRFGHRVSVDLDLFTDEAFNADTLFAALAQRFPTTLKVDEAPNTLSLVIDGVRVDALAHRYRLLRPFETLEGFRFHSVEDVAAMKMGAVSSRGAKKDFWDVAELLKHFSLPKLLGFFAEKYPNSDIGYVVRSLTYFEDAETQANPLSLNEMDWESVKQHMVESVRRLVSNG